MKILIHHHPTDQFRVIFIRQPTSHVGVWGRQGDNPRIRPMSKMAAPPKETEIEFKIRLKDETAYNAVLEALGGVKGANVVHAQTNLFWDGDSGESKNLLSTQRIVLRFRFFGAPGSPDEKCVATIKEKAVVVDGLMTAGEQEGPIPVTVARALIEEPAKWFDGTVAIPGFIQDLISRHKLIKLEFLNGFETNRTVFSWEQHKLELDIVKYPFGTMYEVEVETKEPDALRPKLEALVSKATGSGWSYSKTTKLAIFKAGRLD